MLHRFVLTAAMIAALLPSAGTSWASPRITRIEGYLDFKRPPYLIVDGQRILADARTKFSAGRYRNAAEIPLGYRIEVRGTRSPDGAIVAQSLEAARNGSEFMEKRLLAANNKAEKEYRHMQVVAESLPDGSEDVAGPLIESGADVDRCRGIVDRLLPPFVDPSRVRVYVVDNPDWNAMAMANYSVYVYSGLVHDMGDDELAIVLGHELAHATYEHGRRQAKDDLFGKIAGEAVIIGASAMHHGASRVAVELAGTLGVVSVGNAFSRFYEDQADRVGLRYAYEAGYDVDKAPALWKRMADKYGDGSKAANILFGDHSLAMERAAALQKEIDRNYSGPRLETPSGESLAGR
jgi:Zn-dependent protease with chaperone function